jgi:hypothetical protein
MIGRSACVSRASWQQVQLEAGRPELSLAPFFSNPGMSRALILFLLLVALTAWAVHSGRVVVPEAWNPWAPLRIDAEPNLLTRFKLVRASREDAACRATLAQGGMSFEPLADRDTGPACGFHNAVRISRTRIAVGEPFSLSCRAALSLAMWERHVLQQVAQAELGTRVKAMRHFGSYACRNLYGETGRRRSQHATADALDVAAFRLADDRLITVKGDWQGGTGGQRTPAARFLRAVHDGACHYFDVVLGPDYNRAHADHFHFDRGGGRACR